MALGHGAQRPPPMLKSGIGDYLFPGRSDFSGLLAKMILVID